MTQPQSSAAIASSPRSLLVWLPIVTGLIVLYVPSLVDLFRGIWSTDEQAHGPIVLVEELMEAISFLYAYFRVSKGVLSD